MAKRGRPGPRGPKERRARTPGRGQGRSFGPGAGLAPLGHEPWAESRIECQELTEKDIN